MNQSDRCGHSRAYGLADGRFKCKQCGRRYTWMTAWVSIRLAETTKRRLLELFVLGVPMYRQRFRAPARTPTIERFYRLGRACCAYVEELLEPFEGAIKCDETKLGGARRGKRGWGAAGKVIVLGILQRNGQVKVVDVPTRGNKLIRLVRSHTKPGSLYHTDDWHAYGSLRVQGDHVMIRKERGRPKGWNHINGIEGFWNYAKNWPYLDEDLFPLFHKLLRSTGRRDINPILVRNR